VATLTRDDGRIDDVLGLEHFLLGLVDHDCMEQLVEYLQVLQRTQPRLVDRITKAYTNRYRRVLRMSSS
jgi:hypothetical protein